MLIAWLKLRQRNIGPILEGNGWAINGRVKINIPFGTKLTERAILPTGSKRDLTDPYEDKEAARQRKLVTALFIVLALCAIYVRWDRHDRGRYFWQSPKPATAVVPVTVEVPATSTPAPAK